MSESPFEAPDALPERLAALGRQPVDPAVQSQHLTAMASVRADRSFRTSLAGRLKIAAGVLGGFLLGASGLTAAGAMGPLQPIAAQVAHDVAKVDAPQGPKEKAEKAEKEKAEKARLEDGSIGTARDWTDGCEPVVAGGTTFAGNRGQYLKQIRRSGGDLERAKASTCGMPLGGDDDEATTDEADEPKVETEDEAADDDAGKADDEHGKATAPGQKDKAEPGDKAKGPKDDRGDDEGDDEGDEDKPGTPAGPPAEARKGDVPTPEVDPPVSPGPESPEL